MYSENVQCSRINFRVVINNSARILLILFVFTREEKKGNYSAAIKASLESTFLIYRYL